MSISAHTMGNFVGGLTKVYEEKTVFKACPSCGGRMAPTSKHCIQCSGAINASLQVVNDTEEMLDQHHRIRAALDAGYELADLMLMARRGKLPTWQELGGKAMCEAWWKRNHG